MEPCLVVLLHHHDTFLEEMLQDLTAGPCTIKING